MSSDELQEQQLQSLRQRLPDATDVELDVIASVQSDTMTSPERILALCRAVDHLAKHDIEGDIVECGVWRGGSMAATAKTLIKHQRMTPQLWLYDTFEGMSEPDSRDVDFMGQEASELLAKQQRDDETSIWCYSPMEYVRQTMLATDYPESKIQLVPGKVEDTLPVTLPEKISLLRLDTDWYESTRCEMEYLFPRVVDGGILIVDDYGHWEGCRRAVDEYLEQNNVRLFLHRIDYTGRLAVVSR